MIRHYVPDPARAHLVQDRPREGGEGLPEQPALRRLRALPGGRVEEELAREARRQPRLLGRRAQDRRAVLDVLHQRRHDGCRTSRPGTSTVPSTCSPGRCSSFENEPDITARAIAMDGFNELGFNCYKDGPSKGHPALKDWKFRQALNWAVDLQRVVDVVWLGYTTPGTTIIPPDYYTDPDWHWEPPADVKYTYDPEKAGADARRGRLPRLGRRRGARVQGQAHRARPDRAHRVAGEPADGQAHRRLVRGRRHQGAGRRDGRGAPSRTTTCSTTRATSSPPTTTCSSGAGTSTSTPARC